MDFGPILVIAALAGLIKGFIEGCVYVQNGRTNFRR